MYESGPRGRHLALMVYRMLSRFRDCGKKGPSRREQFQNEKPSHGEMRGFASWLAQRGVKRELHWPPGSPWGL